jgi:hypothetical protein
MKTFRTLGLLLSYPQPAWLAHLDEFRAVIAHEGLLPPKHRGAVLAFIDDLEGQDPLATWRRPTPRRGWSSPVRSCRTTSRCSWSSCPVARRRRHRICWVSPWR